MPTDDTTMTGNALLIGLGLYMDELRQLPDPAPRKQCSTTSTGHSGPDILSHMVDIAYGAAVVDGCDNHFNASPDVRCARISFLRSGGRRDQSARGTSFLRN